MNIIFYEPPVAKTGKQPKLCCFCMFCARVYMLVSFYVCQGIADILIGVQLVKFALL